MSNETKADQSLDEIMNETNEPKQKSSKRSSNSYGKSKNADNYNSNNGSSSSDKNSDRGSGRRDRSSRATPYDAKNSNNRSRHRDYNSSRHTDRDSIIPARTSGSAYLHPAAFQQFPPYPILNSLIVAPMRKIIKVSANSNVKSVAGAISHTTRAGESPTIVATGSESVNQAIKALAIARGYLAENKLDISCQPVFRNQDKGAMSFVLTKTVARTKKQDEDINELRVAKGSDPNLVAGSIANKIRANERVIILSIGAGSVNQTVSAICLARRFLEENAIDLSFRPEFIHIKLEEGERSAIKFVILAQQI